jgi:hypothetical protein
MNWTRGFLRLWLAFAVLWVGIVVANEWHDIHDAFAKARERRQWNGVGETMMPVDCKLARGKEGSDYSLEENGPWIQYRPDPTFHICWYSATRLRGLYPEYVDLSDDEVSDQLYSKANLPYTPTLRPWRELGIAFGAAFGVPLILFALGTIIRWIIRGFRGNSAPRA